MRIELGHHGGNMNHSGWRLYGGGGSRTTDYAIAFRQPFRLPPQVHVGLCSEDVIDGANHRLSVSVIGVGREGFVLRYHTWADTSVWSAAVNWIAIEADRSAFAESGTKEISFDGLGGDVSRENEREPTPSE